jgi:hypothetical protein
MVLNQTTWTFANNILSQYNSEWFFWISIYVWYQYEKLIENHEQNFTFHDGCDV